MLRVVKAVVGECVFLRDFFRLELIVVDCRQICYESWNCVQNRYFNFIMLYFHFFIYCRIPLLNISDY